MSDMRKLVDLTVDDLLILFPNSLENKPEPESVSPLKEIGEGFNIKGMAEIYYNNKDIDIQDLPPQSQALWVSLPTRMLYHPIGTTITDLDSQLLDHAKDRFQSAPNWFMSIMLDQPLIRQLYDLEDKPVHRVLVRPWVNRAKHLNGVISRKKAVSKLQASVIRNVHRAWQIDDGQVVNAIGDW